MGGASCALGLGLPIALHGGSEAGLDLGKGRVCEARSAAYGSHQLAESKASHARAAKEREQGHSKWVSAVGTERRGGDGRSLHSPSARGGRIRQEACWAGAHGDSFPVHRHCAACVPLRKSRAHLRRLQS